ncbi:EthD family reductase [Catellatospora coxensis]|uniref:Uncharacterized protein n=1 Tax=Catellatospora coxensis TaxID=310354 RepID=A0A8J3P647_9ACTN|nr:EthD family reductase [Catellatospora coxensis]GIG05418.1 hypothetical protein Cco03nite_21180 [Catellatospora coxensis]
MTTANTATDRQQADAAGFQVVCADDDVAEIAEGVLDSLAAAAEADRLHAVRPAGHGAWAVTCPDGSVLRVSVGRPARRRAYPPGTLLLGLPIARRMRGLKGWTIGHCEAAAPGERPPYHLIVGLHADTRADLEAILDSPEGRAAVEDVPNFATGGVTFLYNKDQHVETIPVAV